MAYAKKIVVACGIALAVVTAALVIWQLGFVLLLVFAAVLFAILLRGLASFISKRTRAGQGVSLAIVIVGGLAIVAGAGLLMAPRIASQTSELQDQLPQSWTQLQNYLRQLPFGESILSRAEEQSVMQSGDLRSWLSKVFSVTISGVVQVLFVFVVGIYLAAKPQTYIAGVLKLLPLRSRDRACQVMGAVGYTLEWWLIGQLTVMILVGIVTGSGLALLGVPLALSLGVIAGLLEFVPNVGPIVAGIPAVMIAFLSGPETALYVVLLYLAIQQLEGYVLTPLIQRQAVSLEPALIITAQLAFGLTVGAMGVLLATPLTAALLVAVKMLYVEDVLGDRVEVDGADRLEDSCAIDPR